MAVALFFVMGRREQAATSAIERIDRWLLSRARQRLAGTVVITVLFFFVRSDIHLLGDGYTWLATFGQGQSYTPKWTELVSIELIRLIQRLLGGYTREHALPAFQAVAILSGGVFVYNVLSIVRQMAMSATVRVLAVATLLLSGYAVLFMGYVEFYSAPLAAAAVFVNMSLRTMSDRRYFRPALVSFVAAVLLHVMSSFYVLGLIYVAFLPVPGNFKRSTRYHLLGGGGTGDCSVCDFAA